jgi:hypothetical protein
MAAGAVGMDFSALVCRILDTTLAAAGAGDEHAEA